MATKSKTVAYSGSPPGRVPKMSVFDFIFSQPYHQESDFISREKTLPLIEDDRPIYVDNKTDRTLTFAQTRQDALTVAANLGSLGLNPDDIHKLPPTATCQQPEVAPVVLIQLPNCLPFASILYGVFASGLTASLISPALTSSEIGWILQNARPRAIITAKPCLDAMREALKLQTDKAFFSQTPIFTVNVAEDAYPACDSSWISPPTPGPTEYDWKTLLAPQPSPKPYHLPPKSAANRTAVILWSSGTSGRSKGVLLSHNALNFATASLWHDADFSRSQPQPQPQPQSWLGYVPFYHVFGLCNIFLIAPAAGATVYVMPQFSLDAMLAAIPKRRVTYLHMAPPVAVMLAKANAVEPYVRRNAFASIVAGVTGGAPLGHEVIIEVHKRLGFRVRMGYGLSETCNTTIQRGIAEADMHANAGDSGVPHWGVELMIAADGQAFTAADKKTTAAAIDTPGEILIRSPSLMSAYLPIGGLSASQPDMSITTEALTPDGWFRTGDVGMLDARGHIRITDRLKELIKVRAYQVAPAELEAVLCSSEAVADAGVIGVYDQSEATEWPRAFVVARQQDLLRNSETDRKGLEDLAHELRALVESKTAKYKWLKGGIVFVEAIPKSPSGKILRRIIKDGGVKGGVEVMVYQKKSRDSKL